MSEILAFIKAHRRDIITTAAALAAYYRYCEKFGPTEDALLSLCGAGLKSEH